MNNIFKEHRVAIAVCLVYGMLATGGAVFFIKKAAQENIAASMKSAEKLQAAGASLDQANAETAKYKESLEKEKALNENLKKLIAESDAELEKLRDSIKTMTAATGKQTKPKAAPSAAAHAESPTTHADSPTARATPPPAAHAERPPTNVASPNCRTVEPRFSKNKIRALQNLQVDIRKRDKELKEKQNKLDEAAEHMAREKRKLILQNEEYRWPH